MTCVLALDIAMHRTGWALRGSDWDKPQWGVFETRDWAKAEAENLHVWRKHMMAHFDVRPEISHLVIEQVFVDVRSSNKFQFAGTQAQMMLSGIAMQVAYERGAKVMQVNIDDWRKQFLGHNRKPKDFKNDDKYWKTLAMKVAARRDWYVTYHDEAEALGIVNYALAALDRTYALKNNGHEARQHADMDQKRGLFA